MKVIRVFNKKNYKMFDFPKKKVQANNYETIFFQTQKQLQFIKRLQSYESFPNPCDLLCPSNPVS
jgi:hypothetical protein